MPLTDAATDAILGNAPERWAQATAAAAGVVALLWVLRRFTERRLARLAAATDTAADDFAVEMVRGIRTSLFVFVAIVAIDAFIVFPSPADQAVRVVRILAFVLQGFSWTSVIVTFWLGQWARKNPAQSDRTTLAALGFGVRVVLWSLLVLLALQNYGVNVTTLITGLGVGGIAIALAIQNILGDLFAALSIVLDKPFVIGDTIAVDSFEGVVEKVGLKTTRLRSANGEQVIFSNADLLRSRIRNLARREGRRYVLQTTVALDTEAAKLAGIPAIFRQAVEEQPYVALQRSHLIGTFVGRPRVRDGVLREPRGLAAGPRCAAGRAAARLLGVPARGHCPGVGHRDRHVGARRRMSAVTVVRIGEGGHIAVPHAARDLELSRPLSCTRRPRPAPALSPDRARRGLGGAAAAGRGRHLCVRLRHDRQGSHRRAAVRAVLAGRADRLEFFPAC